MPGRIEQYLAELRRALRVGSELAERILEEVAGHLREGVRREEGEGVPRDEAERRAIARFGSPGRVAAGWTELYREETRGGDMWQKFTETARQVVFFAQEEAARLGCSQVSTDHLLLGLVRESDSAASQVLDRLKVARGRIRAGVERQVTRGPGHPRGQDMQLTPRAKAAIDLANEESRALGGEQIGSQHLLLGLLRQAEEHQRVEQATEITGQGILEILPDGWGFLRRFSDFAPSSNDIYVSQGQIERFTLKTGDWLSGRVRPPQERDKYYGMAHIERINGAVADLATVEPEPADRGGAVLLALGIDRQRARDALADLPMES